MQLVGVGLAPLGLHSEQHQAEVLAPDSAITEQLDSTAGAHAELGANGGVATETGGRSRRSTRDIGAMMDQPELGELPVIIRTRRTTQDVSLIGSPIQRRSTSNILLIDSPVRRTTSNVSSVDSPVRRTTSNISSDGCVHVLCNNALLTVLGQGTSSAIGCAGVLLHDHHRFCLAASLLT